MSQLLINEYLKRLDLFFLAGYPLKTVNKSNTMMYARLGSEVKSWTTEIFRDLALQS